MLRNMKIDGKFVMLKFENSRLGGTLVGDEKPLIIDNKIPLKNIQKEVPGLKISREFGSTEFRLDETSYDICKLIEKALSEIKTLAERLQKELS